MLGTPFNAVAIFEKGYLAGTEMTKEKLESYKSDLLFVGYLTDNKNPYEFIQIVKEVSKTHPKIKAVMVGGGDLGSESLKLIGKLGLADNVKMVGFQHNPYIYMNQVGELCYRGIFPNILYLLSTLLSNKVKWQDIEPDIF